MSISNGTTTTLTYYSLNNQRVAVRQNSSALTYLINDLLGGTAVAVALYWPYGNIKYGWGTMPTSYNFTGQRHDSQTGLLYYNFRYYDPVSGRFTRSDTVQTNAKGMDPYAYVGENPETRTDPTGHDGSWWQTALMFTAIAVVVAVVVVAVVLAAPVVLAAVATGEVAGAAAATAVGVAAESEAENVAATAAETATATAETASTAAQTASDTSASSYFFRGTSDGFPGSSALQRLGITPASTNPAVATQFAIRSSSFGRGVLQIATSDDLAGVTIGPGNVLAGMESEVGVEIPPLEFADRASITISVTSARSILMGMDISVPGLISDYSALDTAIRNAPDLTTEQIVHFVRLAQEQYY